MNILEEIAKDYVPTEFDEVMLSCQQVVVDYEVLEKEAVQMAEFIDSTGRVPLRIEEFREKYDPKFQPECWYAHSVGENVTDTEYSSKDTKSLEEIEIENMSIAKEMCERCPLKQSCLAVGLASRKNTRRSKNEKSIPGTEESGRAITLNDFCIYGGYTPGERRIMYNIVCYILEEKDKRGI